MAAPLLTTKPQIPPLTPHETPRPRLVDALECSVLSHKLVLLATPAGYGKTTLLAQWARVTGLSVVWLTLDQGDNDLERFLRYLLAGWEKVQPGMKESKLGLLLSGMAPDSESVLAAFINVANETPNPLVFVLDDYHLIEESAIHQALTFLLDHLPPTLHFVLAGRAEPPLPLARYRARAELLELRMADLQFRLAETQDFLNGQMGLALRQVEVATLHAQLEGWIAGLQLVALTRRQHLMGADQLVVSGRHRFIADYLQEDVLSPQPDNLRHFLRQTSILDRLCGPLCDAVTGRADGQAMLEILERKNLFLMPLDDNRQWFRYHSLFASFLQEELHRHHAVQVADLQRRAARWYLAQDLPEPAFQHALAGEDAELVLQLGERYFDIKLLSGEFRLLHRWLAALPAQWQVEYPLIGLYRTGLLLFTGELDAGARCIDEVEQGLAQAKRADTDWQLARVTAVRCAIACFQNDLTQAEAYADISLQGLPPADRTFRTIIYHALGDTYRHHGRWMEARTCYHNVLDLAHGPAFPIRSVHVFGALADLALQQGQLRNSAAYWKKALAIIQEEAHWGSFPLPLIGWVFIRLGEILYEWNERDEASTYLNQGLERAELGGDVRAMLAGCLIVGWMKLNNGDVVAAAAYLERARPLVENTTFPEWSGRFERFQLEFWLAEDRLRAAVAWADERMRSDAGEGRPDSDEAHLAMARVLIAKGDRSSIERALTLLLPLLQVAETEGRTGVTIKALALQSLAHWRRGDRADALTSLERALRLAEPEGYVRLFADLGLPMARLLQEACSRAVMPDYVAKLLAAYDADLALPALAGEALPEPLTQREQEILKLIAAGLTNREIAQQLVVSAETVKKHAAAIYGKLGVRSRTEAAARARELDLLT
jgi:LuxR family maltose regulon positive regulatory protein